MNKLLEEILELLEEVIREQAICQCSGAGWGEEMFSKTHELRTKIKESQCD